MAHQASYRVYRPRRFSEVYGQSRTVETLQEAVRQGRLTHAYLFSGPRGTGKTSVARILAKAVNCEQLKDDGNPCLECASCLSIERGQHLDVIEIDAASNRGIDEIRDIKERITHQTAMSRYKVYIIDEVHMLTSDAFNALLKTLEEPPRHVVFVLATTEAHKLPATVLSRCQRYEFKRHTVGVIQDRLRFVAEHEGVIFEPEALEVLAEAGDGSLRDALSLFDQVVVTEGAIRVDGVARVAGVAGQRQMARLMGAMADSIEALIAVLTELRGEGLDEKLILRDLARQFRDLLLFRTAGSDIFPPYRREGLISLDAVWPASVPAAWWIDAADQLAQAESRLKGGFPADLAVELAVLKVQQRLLSAGGAEPTVTAAAVGPAAKHQGDQSAGLPVPEPPSAGNAVPVSDMPAPREFKSVLDIVRRERPTTYALFDKAAGVVGPDGILTIRFEFPAHRDLMSQPNNREVVDRAVRTVFGADTQYRFVVGTEDLPRQEKVEPLLQDAVHDWFGDDVKLMGFDQD